MVAPRRNLLRVLGIRRVPNPLGPPYLPINGPMLNGVFFRKMANGQIEVRTTRGRRPTGSRWISVAANGRYFQRYFRGGQTRYVPENEVIATFGADYLSVLSEARTFYIQELDRLRRRHDAACREFVRLSRAITEANNYSRAVAAYRGENHECAVEAQARVVALREQLASVISHRASIHNAINQPIVTPVQVL